MCLMSHIGTHLFGGCFNRRYTWMHERYGCDGTMQLNRTAAYFEYPSTVAILLREIRYGIELAFDHVTVDPMPKTAFSYHIGNVNIDCTYALIS